MPRIALLSCLKDKNVFTTISMKQRALFIISIFIILLSPYLKGQDPVYSQFYNAPLELNPAFTGMSNGPIFTLNYRNQWPKFGNVYSTYSASYNQVLFSKNSGFGFGILTDNAGNGTIKTTKVSGYYGYRASINKDFQIKMGLGVAMVQQRLDWDKLLFGDQLDPRLGSMTPGGTPIPSSEVRPDNLSNRYFDISIGVLAYGPRLYGGISLDHVSGPDQTFLESDAEDFTLPVKWSAHAGYKILISDNRRSAYNVFVSPNVIFAKQSDFYQLNMGAYFNIKALIVGAWYRFTSTNGDAFIGSFGMKKGAFKFTYSYDFTVSDLAQEVGGSHEFGIVVDLWGEKSEKIDINNCLELFR